VEQCSKTLFYAIFLRVKKSVPCGLIHQQSLSQTSQDLWYWVILEKIANQVAKDQNLEGFLDVDSYKLFYKTSAMKNIFNYFQESHKTQ